jgi:hypothetical protein
MDRTLQLSQSTRFGFGADRHLRDILAFFGALPLPTPST